MRLAADALAASVNGAKPPASAWQAMVAKMRQFTLLEWLLQVFRYETNSLTKWSGLIVNPANVIDVELIYK